MNDCTLIDKRVKEQQRIMEVIELKSKEVNGMIECHEKAVEEDILQFLVQYQSLLSRTCLEVTHENI